jgi:DNA polymerase/3'-5' exonuclease PolX
LFEQAAAVVRSLPSVITSGAALSKGKGKVDGIGQKCGELIDEFLETGAIAKIAEKRAELG